MTEDEARTKLCCGPPMLFAIMGALKDQRAADTTLCQASACMAWRWAYGAPDEDGTVEVLDRSGIYGHCGLAGHP